MNGRDTTPVRAVRAVMGWHGDDVTALAGRLGVSRSALTRRFERGLTGEQLREIADTYGVDPVDLAMGRMTQLLNATREYASPVGVAL